MAHRLQSDPLIPPLPAHARTRSMSPTNHHRRTLALPLLIGTLALFVPRIALAGDSPWDLEQLRMVFFGPLALVVCAPFALAGLVVALLQLSRPSPRWQRACAPLALTNLTLGAGLSAAAGQLLPICVAAIATGLCCAVVRITVHAPPPRRAVPRPTAAAASRPMPAAR